MNKERKGKILSDEEFEARLAEVLSVVTGEVNYARHWDKERFEREGLTGGGELFDSEKPVETYLLWAGQYLQEANEAATGSFDKTKALENVRKAAGILVTCMMHKGASARQE